MAITINLAATSFKPGDVISGNVEFGFEGNRLPKELKIRLAWFTQGKSTQDKIYCDEAIIPLQETGTFEFTLKPPPFPWSYEGKLFSVQWMVAVEADSKTLNYVIINYCPDGFPIKA